MSCSTAVSPHSTSDFQFLLAIRYAALCPSVSGTHPNLAKAPAASRRTIQLSVDSTPMSGSTARTSPIFPSTFAAPWRTSRSLSPSASMSCSTAGPPHSTSDFQFLLAIRYAVLCPFSGIHPNLSNAPAAFRRTAQLSSDSNPISGSTARTSPIFPSAFAAPWRTPR